jgi:hypothetical protein
MCNENNVMQKFYHPLRMTPLFSIQNLLLKLRPYVDATQGLAGGVAGASAGGAVADGAVADGAFR